MKYQVIAQEVYADNACVVEIYGQGCNYPTKTGVDGFQVDFDIEVEIDGGTEEFHVVYQSEDRSDNMYGYSRFGMETADKFGCDADESTRLAGMLEWDSRWEQIDSDLSDKAAMLCREWAESINVGDADSLEFKIKNELASLELKRVQGQAVERGVKPDGVWVMNELKRLGWVSKSYIKMPGSSVFNAIHTDFHVICGYSGGYNHCHLVKPL